LLDKHISFRGVRKCYFHKHRTTSFSLRSLIITVTKHQ